MTPENEATLTVIDALDQHGTRALLDEIRSSIPPL
jgi:hypothetical protein